jgi:hypothetical protein
MSWPRGKPQNPCRPKVSGVGRKLLDTVLCVYVCMPCDAHLWRLAGEITFAKMEAFTSADYFFEGPEKNLEVWFYPTEAAAQCTLAEPPMNLGQGEYERRGLRLVPRCVPNIILERLFHVCAAFGAQIPVQRQPMSDIASFSVFVFPPQHGVTTALKSSRLLTLCATARCGRPCSRMSTAPSSAAITMSTWTRTSSGETDTKKNLPRNKFFQKEFSFGHCAFALIPLHMRYPRSPMSPSARAACSSRPSASS